MNKFGGKISSRKVLAESHHEKAIHSKATVIILYESTELLLNCGVSLVEIGPIAKSGRALAASGAIPRAGLFLPWGITTDILSILLIQNLSIWGNIAVGQYHGIIDLQSAELCFSGSIHSILINVGILDRARHLLHDYGC